MKIKCSKCDATYNVDEKKIPAVAKRIKCPKCHSIISILKPQIMAKVNPEKLKEFILCPFCAEEIPKHSKICEHCGENLHTNKTIIAPTKSKMIEVALINNGRVMFSCPYDKALNITENAMVASGAKIKKIDKVKGLIVGKCRYGINLFGITINCIFYSKDSKTIVSEITASFTDAIDTVSACENKVAQICREIVWIAKNQHSMPQNHGEPVIKTATDSNQALTSITDQMGPCHRKKAITGFIFSLVGIFLGVTSVPGIIISSIALNSIFNSKNKKGKGIALAGVIIGAFSTLVWAGILLEL